MVKRHVRFNPNKFRQQSDPKKNDVGAPPIPIIPSQYLSKSVFRTRITVLEEWDNTIPSLNLKTTEEWETNVPPSMARLTTEEWSNTIRLKLLLIEHFSNNPGAQSDVTTETMDGYTVDVNAETTQSGLTALEANTVSVVIEEDRTGAGDWQQVFSGGLGNVSTVLFYPGRGHRTTVSPTTIGGKTVDAATKTWTPSYSSKTTTNFTWA
jgi:hypothetical protein